MACWRRRRYQLSYRQWLDSNHHRHCPRAHWGCQTGKSGIKGIIPFYSITYEIINRLYVKCRPSKKKPPKGGFPMKKDQPKDLLLFSRLNGNHDGDIITYVRRIFAHIEFGTLHFSFCISAAILHTRHWMLLAIKVRNF